MDTLTLIGTPLDLWRELYRTAGLELKVGRRAGRDADVEESLRRALGAPNGKPSLEKWLAADAKLPTPSVSIELLLTELLKTQGGFAQMMRGIFDVLIKAQATGSPTVLSVDFTFDAVSGSIRETLEAFRKTVERIQKVSERRPKLPDKAEMWSYVTELQNFLALDVAPKQPPVTEPFGPVPPIPNTGHAPLDTQLELIRQLVAGFRKLWRKYGFSRDEVGVAAGPIHNAGNDLLAAQLFAATDFWDESALRFAKETSRRVGAGELDPSVAEHALARIFANVEWGDVWVEHTVRELLDILNLPVWKRRHELYSVWTGTRLLNAIQGAHIDLRFHPVEGVLSFSFSGSLLASFNWNGEQFDVWSELRSELVGSSKKRKRGIQPDFRVLKGASPEALNNRTTLVLECKHYLKPNTANFVQAADDYARTCTNALVLVVNHGPADDTALREKLPVGLRKRIQFIGDVTPDADASTQVLTNAIREALFPTLTVASATVAHVVLEWDDSLSDMDLSLQLLDGDGSVGSVVDFRNMGDLRRPPFACLLEDVTCGPGKERIEIAAWHASDYRLVATKFSGDGVMGSCNLFCSIVTSNGQTHLRPTGLTPDDGQWTIGELWVRNGVAEVIPSGASNVSNTDRTFD